MPLTDAFWEEAKKYDAGLYPRIDIRNWGATFADTVNTSTHCGTLEIAGIHKNTKQSGKFENVVALVCRSAMEGFGHLLYYAPQSEQYYKAVQLLEKAGFEKVSNFTHYGYLGRKPDHGRSQMWELSLTEEEYYKIRSFRTNSDWEKSDAGCY